MPLPKKKVAKKTQPKQVASPRKNSRFQPIQKPTSDLAMLIYGKSGTGKSTIAATAVDAIESDELHAHISVGDEDGTLSIFDVDRIVVPERPDTLKKFNTILDDILNEGIRSASIDTIGDLTGLAIADVTGTKPKQQIGFGDLTIKQWGDVTARMKEAVMPYLEASRDGKLLLTILAHEKEFNNNEDAGNDALDPYVSCDVLPAFGKWLLAKVDYIGRSFIREVEVPTEEEFVTTNEAVYSLLIGPDSKYITKFRKPKSKKIPDFIDDPSLSQILEIARG